MRSSHDRLWHWHPKVPTGDQLSRGERAADHMKALLATWTALITVLAVIVGWIYTAAFGIDKSPYFRLNLGLSCFAALQCFVLLIANKRGEQIAAATLRHTEQLLEENTRLTKAIHEVTCIQTEGS